MRFETHLPRILHVEAENGQLALGADAAVQLAQRARGGVAGIGKKLLTGGFPLGIEPLKDLDGHINLAPHPKTLVPGFHFQRDIKDGAKIFGDVLPHFAVAPGSAQNEATVFIFQTDRKAVDLELHGVFRFWKALLHPAVELPDLVKGKHILQALHGIGVVYLLESR